MMTRKKVSNGSNVGEGLEITKCGGNQSMQQFRSGDIAWIRIRDCSWWPGQVIDENSVSFTPKKKAKDGILVRMYGTYEYLYVDPVKCVSDFKNNLEKENTSVKEVVMRTLEEDLSRVRSGGKSKRKVSESRETARSDAPKSKKQKRDSTGRIEEADSILLPGASSDVEEVSEKGKSKPIVKTTRGRKALDDKDKNLKPTNAARDGASRAKSVEQGGAGKAKSTGMAGNGGFNMKKLRDRDRTTKNKSVKPGEGGKPDVIEKFLNGASVTKDTKQNASKRSKRKDVQDQMPEKSSDEASKEQNASKRSKQKGVQEQKTEETSDKASKEQKGSKRSKRKDVQEQKTRRSGAEPSKEITPKQGRTRKSNVRENVPNGASKIKDTKHHGSKRPNPKEVQEKNFTVVYEKKAPKHDAVGNKTVKEKARASTGKNAKQNGPMQSESETNGKTKSPSISGRQEESTGDLSARRMRVMQSLGLIAPQGSPFRRNGFTIATALQQT